MEIDKILQNNGFRFNKSLGQNFLTDKNLLSAIVSDAGITGQDVVVEIGAGAGTLTAAIAEKAKKVYAFEVDRRLQPVLSETLRAYDNVEVVFQDVLKMSDTEFCARVPCAFKVVANLPYYITTPLLMRFVEGALPVGSVTVTVQKEVAERFAASPGSPAYGAITVQIDLRGTAKITRAIGRKMFYPAPNVDSAVVRVVLDRDRYPEDTVSQTSKLVKIAFAMRRKTLLNNLSAAYPVSKEQLKQILADARIPADARGETLSTAQFLTLAERLNRL